MLFFGFQVSAGRFLITVVLLCVIEMASFGWMSAIISARSEMEMVCCLDLLSFLSCLLRHQSCICASSIHIWRSFSCHRNCTQKFCVSRLCVRQRFSPHLFQTGSNHIHQYLYWKQRQSVLLHQFYSLFRTLNQRMWRKYRLCIR